MVHLHVHSWYSFLAGASSPQALAQAAAEAGQCALALTDTHTLAGVVQHAKACKAAGIKAVFGATIDVDGFPLVLLCADREGYANLCDLLTLAHADRLQPHLDFEQLQDRTAGLLCLTGDRWGYLATMVRSNHYPQARQFLTKLQTLFPDRLFVELTHHRRPGDGHLIERLTALAGELHLPVVAANGVRHAGRAGYALYDALTCARLGITIADPHPLRPVNDQAYLRSESQMQWLGFSKAALANSDAIAGLCDVDLLPDRVTPPAAHLPPGIEASDYLRDLCCAAMRRKYRSQGERYKADAILARELSVINELELPEFFLVVREVIEAARVRGIRCSGRGSAANSVVAYLLGITGVCPIRHKLLFERFLHTGRKGMPDIDVDFETHRRQEVISWMAQRFGEEHTAMTANVITFRLRLAVREMAKVLGYPLCLIDRLSKALPHASARRVREHRKEIALILGESLLLEILLCLVERFHDGYAVCPRHLSLHSGGMILSRAPLRTLSPIQSSANGVRQIQFNKDDVEALGLIKFDVLGLRTLSVVTEAIELLRDGVGKDVDVDDLALDDAKTFELIRAGETMSVFQIESPGQWNLLSRTQPTVFDDLVCQVALFRPGPLQGNMVHPFILRRRGLQKTTYPHPSLERVLKDTHGIILFQEQVLEVAHHFAGLSLTEADEFRRLMSKFRDAGEMEGMRARFVEGAMTKHNGSPCPVSAQLANQVFDVIAKFVGYGFCRSHAAAFAHIVYQTAYLKAHHPAAYMAGVLEHKPGFYPLQSVLEEARHCGVRVLPVDIEKSDVKYRLERAGKGYSIRVPLTQVKGLCAESAARIVLERAVEPFRDLESLYQRVRLGKDVWENLVRAGALDAFGTRRKVLWKLGELIRRVGPSGGDQLSLDAGGFAADLPALKKLSLAEITAWNFQTTDITTGPHPIALHRSYLERLGVTPIRELLTMKPGGRVLAAGSVISRQRPPTAKGMTFVILEDETGRLPTAITPPVYEKVYREVREPGLLVEGMLEGSGPGQIGSYRSVLIQRLWPLGRMVGRCVSGYWGHPGQTAR
jgi:error-prone DNA polymerase